MKRLIAMALLLALAGCASMQMQWDRPGTSSAQFEQDKQQCIYEVQLHNPTMFLEALPLVAQCMRAKGYQQVQR